jgi:hypothetical protein
MAPRLPSPTALTDHAWHLRQHLGPQAKPGGRPADSPHRASLHAIFSLLRSGGAWRMRPHALPPWRREGPWPVRPDLRRGEVRAATEGGAPRQPGGQAHGKRGGPGLRHAQPGHGAPAPPPGRDARRVPRRGGHGRQGARPRRGDPAAGAAPCQSCPTAAHLGGSGVWRGPEHGAMGPPALAEHPLGHGQAT